MKWYNKPDLRDHGTVTAVTRGDPASSTHEPFTSAAKLHIRGAPAGKTIEPTLTGFETEAETLGDDDTF